MKSKKISPAAAEEGGRLDIIHDDILQQVAAGNALCELLERNDEFGNVCPGIDRLFKNIFNELDKSCTDLDTLIVGIEKGKERVES